MRFLSLAQFTESSSSQGCRDVSGTRQLLFSVPELWLLLCDFSLSPRSTTAATLAQHPAQHSVSCWLLGGGASCSRSGDLGCSGFWSLPLVLVLISSRSLREERSMQDFRLHHICWHSIGKASRPVQSQHPWVYRVYRDGALLFKNNSRDQFETARREQPWWNLWSNVFQKTWKTCCFDLKCGIRKTRFNKFSKITVCVCVQSCPTFCDPMDRSPPGSSVYGYLTKIKCTSNSAFWNTC